MPSLFYNTFFVYFNLISNGEALGYGLDGPGSIPGDGEVEIFLHSFMFRLVLSPTQPPIK